MMKTAHSVISKCLLAAQYLRSEGILEITFSPQQRTFCPGTSALRQASKLSVNVIFKQQTWMSRHEGMQIAKGRKLHHCTGHC